MTNKIKFIIHTPSYDENTGGIIALHYLCHLLNKSGHEAYVTHLCAPNSFINLLRYLKKKTFVKFTTNPLFETPIFKGSISDDCVIIYPEIIAGNPLGGKNVVRWFLNKPGKLTGIIDYGTNELYFFYQKVFNCPEINKDSTNLFTLLYYLDDIYVNRHLSSRVGKCYILRKGVKRVDRETLNDGIIIDGKTHQEIAEIFNNVEYCISYDPYTFYSYYATLCGCKSIVIPLEGLNEEEWQPDENLRVGINYGFKNIKDTEIESIKFTKYLADEKERQVNSIHQFVNKTKSFFNLN